MNKYRVTVEATITRKVKKTYIIVCESQDTAMTSYSSGSLDNSSPTEYQINERVVDIEKLHGVNVDTKDADV